MRYVEFSPKADLARTELIAPERLTIDHAIIAIAHDARPAGGADPRFVAGDGVNSGLIATIVRAGRHHYSIIYRIRSADDVVWIEDLRPVFFG